ncbi:MAG: RNA methyltransferase [Muribaculaceae bacterium]|jgi:TrmH family RNA methyltransferase
MITKRTIKLVNSLADARDRRETGLFVAEGTKCVLDVLPHFTCRYLFAEESWLDANAAAIPAAAEVVPATRGELRMMTRLMATPPVIALFGLPPAADVDSARPDRSLVVALDRVQDPGNLGTIIRTCDWMGVETIVASHDCVDAFSPKVVQSTMGAIARVRVIYTDLPAFVASLPEATEVYGTFLDGDNIYSTALASAGLLVMGNEGSGISPQVAEAVTRRLFIPPFPAGRPTSESLNVATATAICLSEFRSRQLRES